MGLTNDQLRGRVKVLIDGEDLFLRFDQNSLSKLIDALGLDGIANLPSAISSLDGTTLRTLVWAGRLWEDPTLKETEVEGWFYPLLPTYNAALQGINLSLWGELEPDFGGSDDEVDP